VRAVSTECQTLPIDDRDMVVSEADGTVYVTKPHSAVPCIPHTT
jgi:hypothetical protein